MPSLFDTDRRRDIQRRIDELEPDRPGRWGKLTAPEMVCHVSDQLRVALGELEAAIAPSLLRYRVLREIPVYWLPWPKGKIATAPEMLTTRPTDWPDDVRSLHKLVERLGERSPAVEWGAHPVFGRISGREWGRLCWKHLDYHLRQFGV